MTASTDDAGIANLDGVAKLLALNDIGELKARYFRFVDTKNWEGLRTSVFTEDFHGDYSEVGGGTYDNAEDVIAMLTAALSEATTAHMGSMPEISFTGPEAAVGIWAMNDRLEYPTGILTGAGHYHETYLLGSDGWRISAAKITRLYQRFDTIESPAQASTD